MGDTATDVSASGTTGTIPDQEVCKIDTDCIGEKSICCPAYIEVEGTVTNKLLCVPGLTTDAF